MQRSQSSTINSIDYNPIKNQTDYKNISSATLSQNNPDGIDLSKPKTPSQTRANFGAKNAAANITISIEDENSVEFNPT